MASGLHLDDFDRLCLENYIALLQLSYMDWKRQNPDPKYSEHHLQ
jgi:hypothetical protein